MSVYDLNSIPGVLTRTALTIGMFDGVHLGHRALLQALREEAERLHGQSVVLTFDRHPFATVWPEKTPKLITTLEQRLAAIRAAGVDVVVVAKFDEEMAETTPREFFERIIVERLKAATVIVGPDFRFGKNRAGDFKKLAEYGVEKGVSAVAIPPMRIDDTPVSSTRIRTLLKHGAVEQAARLLGHPFVLEGQVVKGAGLGKKLGFPTANLRIDADQLAPGDGVYSADVLALGRAFAGVVSIGSQPTLGGSETVIEAHIADFKENLYGERIRVGFRSRLRDQRKFRSLDHLVQQMRVDLDTALQEISGDCPATPAKSQASH